MRFNSTTMNSLKGIETYSTYPSGLTQDCMLSEYNEVETAYGVLVPQYDNSEVRRKFTKSLSFYESGQIKSISLHNQTVIDTPAGTLPAELITFYESGAIKRIFPLNGKISGYWSEKDEYSMAEIVTFDLHFGKLTTKIICVHFYENGSINSLTLWPGDSLKIPSPAGAINTRIGLSLYPDGSIKSLEPDHPIIVDTPIGKISAFDTAAIGIHGDTNSLCFNENGSIKSIVTSSDIVRVHKNSKMMIYSPGFRPSMLDSTKNELVPLRLYFQNKSIALGENTNDTYDMDGCAITIKYIPELLNSKCGNCESCNACG